MGYQSILDTYNPKLYAILYVMHFSGPLILAC